MKVFFTWVGALVILLAFALNLRHASNGYALRSGTFWSYVEAQNTTDGSGNGSTYCLLGICLYPTNCVEQYLCAWVPKQGGEIGYAEDRGDQGWFWCPAFVNSCYYLCGKMQPWNDCFMWVCDMLHFECEFVMGVSRVECVNDMPIFSVFHKVNSCSDCNNGACYPTST